MIKWRFTTANLSETGCVGLCAWRVVRGRRAETSSTQASFNHQNHKDRVGQDDGACGAASGRLMLRVGDFQ